ncbi:hypothetical protein H7347_06760 [Corynebacterium sp. zg-331]|uniref:hypothetical protein n=1 Tax=unclassified Corynebacterium TaxID=2624378 RepID=UPI00128D71EF|nr:MULTISPECIES: hypothetical protein [unclassified Corynebacterium]MBC3186273.1 hypothetical protein [Corynebacterium sp. zg-331]MPV52761.1 hypothetical protein [Corynebacterium sp. zg331]
MKRTFAAASIAVAMTAGAVAPAQANEFLDENRTVFDEPQCPSTTTSDNEFLGKKQSVFDQCTAQEKKPAKEKDTSKPAKPNEATKPSEAAAPDESPASEKPATPSKPSESPKPGKKSPLSDIDKEKLKEQVQGSVQGYKTVQPIIKVLMKALHIVRKIFIPFP